MTQGFAGLSRARLLPQGVGAGQERVGPLLAVAELLRETGQDPAAILQLVGLLHTAPR